MTTELNLGQPLDDLLASLHACHRGREWAKPYKTAAAAWAACVNAEWMLWALDQTGYASTVAGKRTLRLFACACVRKTPLLDGGTVWDLLTDARLRGAVEVSERYARGQATEGERAAAAAGEI